MKKNISWYYKRLKKMSLYEISHRFFESGICVMDKIKYRNGWPEKQGTINTELLNSNLGYSLRDRSDKILSIYPKSYSIVDFSFDNEVFFKRLSLTSDFDIRLYWESQRFNELLALALYNHNQGSEQLYVALIRWMDSNKPLTGVNYISTMECSIRCINLYAALCVLEVEGGVSSELSALSKVFFLVNYSLIKNRLSLFSSRGNHTLFEYAGLVVCASIIKPKKLNYWLDKCVSEFNFQVLDDGAGIEQTTGYHLFNIELQWFIEHFFISQTKKSNKLELALNFISVFIQDNKIVRIGDSDSSVLFSKPFVEEILSANDGANFEVKTFNKSGITVLKNKKLTCYFKYGGLGLAPLFGHGHYDFLSINLFNESGQLITSDAQTYLYNNINRNKYRSSAYHSMPFCGEDDIKQLSPFSWAENRTAVKISNEDDWVVAEYTRNDGNVIKRSVKLTDDYLLIVDDLLVCTNGNELSSRWLIEARAQCFNFFSIVEGELQAIKPNVTKLDKSSIYGKSDTDKISCYDISTSNKSTKLLTVFSLSVIDYDFSKDKIKLLLTNI